MASNLVNKKKLSHQLRELDRESAAQKERVAGVFGAALRALRERESEVMASLDAVANQARTELLQRFCMASDQPSPSVTLPLSPSPEVADIEPSQNTSAHIDFSEMTRGIRDFVVVEHTAPTSSVAASADCYGSSSDQDGVICEALIKSPKCTILSPFHYEDYDSDDCGIFHKPIRRGPETVRVSAPPRIPRIKPGSLLDAVSSWECEEFQPDDGMFHKPLRPTRQ